MKLWAVHPVEVWEKVRDTGEIWVDSHRINSDGYVHPAYQWLARRLQKQLVPRPDLN